MRLTTQSSNQVHTIFGGGYVVEQHNDATYRWPPSNDVGEVIESLIVSMVDELMKSLRSALPLR